MLPRIYRLSDWVEIDKVKRGKRYLSPLFVLFWIEDNGKKLSRFSFVCSKTVSGKAVLRNRIKRQMSEIVRKKLDNIKPGFKILIVAKKEIAFKKYEEIETELLKVFGSEGIIK